MSIKAQGWSPPLTCPNHFTDFQFLRIWPFWRWYFLVSAQCPAFLEPLVNDPDKFEVKSLFLDHAAEQTFLEDFQLDAQNAKVHNENAEQLELAFTIPNDTDGLSLSEFYSKAVDNLKQKYGKLSKLRLRGGYIFKPSDAVSKRMLVV